MIRLRVIHHLRIVRDAIERVRVELGVWLVLVSRLGWGAVGGAVPRPAVDHAHVGGQLTQVPAGATADRSVERAAPYGRGEALDVGGDVRQIPVSVALRLGVHGPRR